jgi:hypothetical protein
VRIIGYAALLLVIVLGVVVVRRLVRSWRDTYGGTGAVGGADDDQG